MSVTKNYKDVHYFKQPRKLKCWGGWVGRSVKVDATKATACLLIT